MNRLIIQIGILNHTEEQHFTAHAKVLNNLDVSVYMRKKIHKQFSILIFKNILMQ